ncbi:UvrD-helicase domain-containing protein [Tahibacter harae]
MKINAYAGAGKTSTLKMLANSTRHCGQYIAFNKAIVADTQGGFPANVDCSTLHSLAYRAIAPSYRGLTSKLTGKINANELAQAFDLKQQAFGSDLILAPRSQAFLFLDTVRRFAQSAETAILPEHVPSHGALRAASPAIVRTVQAYAIAGAQKLWDRMVSPTDLMPLGHDGYLKLWALSRPLIGADFILLDEAQDTNPVVLGVLADQEAQMVYVGDKYQQIYEWRGAVNAMDTIQTDATVELTMSFRFGQAIADLASKVLRQLGATSPIQGNPKVRSHIGVVKPGAVLARSNASTMNAVIEALNSGQAPHLVGGTNELKALLRGVVSLKAGQPCDVPDFFGFTTWAEVAEFARSEEGAYLLTFVNLVESLGERRLLWALGRTVDENRADLMISTGHKAKGREWKSVRLMDDFMRSKPTALDRGNSGHDPAELRLLYVALTRAKIALEAPASILSLIGT